MKLPDFNTSSAEYVTKAVSDRIVSDIRAALKEPVMAQLERDVDRALDAVIAGLNLQLEAALDPRDLAVKVAMWRGAK